MNWIPKVGQKFRAFEMGYFNREARNSPAVCTKVTDKYIEAGFIKFHKDNWRFERIKEKRAKL